MIHRDVIAVGGSVGATEALQALLSDLPLLPAAILAVIHIPNMSVRYLPEMLARSSRWSVSFAEDGEASVAGRVYIAPPGRHLLLTNGRLCLGTGPTENRARPAIDPLFRSVALEAGVRGIGLILSGGQDDGSAGLLAVKTMGGIGVVQEPTEALAQDMPRNAIQSGGADHVLGLAALPALLARLVTEEVAAEAVAPPVDLRLEVEVARGKLDIDGWSSLGMPSLLTCPECHGALRVIQNNGHTHFRCHTGHAFSPPHIALALDEELWRALGFALRAIQERILLIKSLREKAVSHEGVRTAWDERIREYQEQAAIVQRVMLQFVQSPQPSDR